MINVNAAAGIYTLMCKQIVPISIEEAWLFFIAPESCNNTTTGYAIWDNQRHEGQIITYLVSVLPRVKTKWVAEITHMYPNHYFIDEERYGPYAMWHHEHRFEVVEKGTLILDKVSYKLPLGWLGRFFGERYVTKKLLDIFEFRSRFLLERFSR